MDDCPVGYKRTEVGVIPEDWSLSTIGENTHWSSGGTPNRKRDDYWEGTIPWISGSTLKALEISTSDQFLTEEGVAAGSNMAPVNSTLLLVRGSALHKCIRAGIVVSPVSFNQDVKSLMPIESVHPKFLTLFIKGMESELLKLVSSAGNSAGVLDTLLVKNFKFLKPGFSEQTAIANALSDVDALITSLQRLITKKRAIKTAAMQQLLTGKKRLPPFDETHTGYKQTEQGEIPEDWEICHLGDIGVFLKGSGVKKDESNSGHIPCVRYGEIYTRHNDYIKKFNSYISREVSLTATKLFRGDLLFAGSGETKEDIGKCVAFVDEVEAYAGGDIVILRPKWGDPLFWGYSLNSDNVVKQKSGKGQGDAVVHISANALRSVRVIVPSSEVEQQAITKVLLDFDKDIESLKHRLTKTQQLKQGMMQELLTGKTRLV